MVIILPLIVFYDIIKTKEGGEKIAILKNSYLTLLYEGGFYCLCLE